MEEYIRKNPWLGLESYKEGEVLYGRDDDIRDLSQSVLNDSDTLLYGKSGIGKSSILNAGIIPAARRYGFLPVLIRLSHKGTQTYLCQIKDAIANAIFPIPMDESGNQRLFTNEEHRKSGKELGNFITEVVECKDNEKETLYEYFHRHTFHNTDGERIKLLIIFDQFEEIFTLQSDESLKKQFFAELADFLNDIMPTYLMHDYIPSAEPQNKIVVSDADNFDNLFGDLNFGAENSLPEYVTDNDIHLVLTIREDFLSEFEYYTSSIPSLKQNRYGLRPINEEQAAQIILRPKPGLISKTVAKMIIEKVTGRTDFELDGIPEIEVDAAVLSLYLNRLYVAKTSDKITSELIEEKGEEIIKDFYTEAISEISENTIEYLENRLINGQGRRENITIYDAKTAGHVTIEEIEVLCNKKKILRQFYYAGDLRIEYVHDILCPVVMNHKDKRKFIKQQEEERLRIEKEKQEILLQEQVKREKIRKEAEDEKRYLLRKQEIQEKENKLLLRQQEEERQRQEREKLVLEEEKRKYQNKVKRNRLYFFLIVIIAVIASPLINNYAFPPARWELQLVEDQTVGSENYWKAKVSVLNELCDTLFPPQYLDKTHCQTTFPTQRISKVRVVVQFLAGNFYTIDTLMNVSDSVSIPISRAYGRKKYEGKVIYGRLPGQPLKNAVVIIGNQITKTNYKGLFTVYVEKNDISADGTIIIFKNGYKLLNTKIKDGNPYYKLQPEDPMAFEKKLLALEEQMADSCILMTGNIAGSACLLKACMKRDSIFGYYYYDSILKKEMDFKFAKIIFSGKINKDKTFHLDCSDWVYNAEELNGVIKEDNSWEGYWHSYSPNLQKFKFIVKNQ